MKVIFVVKKKVKRNDLESQATIYVRLRDGRAVDLMAPTEFSINPNLWDSDGEQVKSKVVCSDEFRNKINDGLRKLKSFVETEYQSTSKENVSTEWLKEVVDKYHHPENYKTVEGVEAETKPTFEQLFNRFLKEHKLSEVRQKNFRVIKRACLRYELYVRETKRGQKSFILDIDNVTSDTLRDIWNFFENEHEYYELYPAIYEQIPEKRKPKPRGENTLIDYFCRIRTFFLWCYNDAKITDNKPFDNFHVEECVYGSPIYPTLEERDKLYEADFSDDKELETQRNIFVFQSLIGSRIGDYYRMKKHHVIKDAIEYIARKTIDGHPVTVRVPLNEKAKAILAQYKDCEGDQLLPFIPEQEYNKYIKVAFEKAGLDRMVTLLDPLTRQEVKKPLYEVASSHMARRTFIGNLYKRVKDPNLIGSLSGHKEGSKAFNRYRDIDEEMKKELVNLLD